MILKTDLIRNKAVELIKGNRDGLRFSELMDKLEKEFPEWSDSIGNAAWNIHDTRSDKVYKPARGLFKYRFPDVEEIGEIEKLRPMPREEDFYEPFASYLKNDLNECTEAIPLGGNCLGKKWGTPDVIGTYKPSLKDVIRFQTEIISAEIKTEPSDPITAFGQAIAYRLFSSKVYLVEPSSMSKEDQDRIEALCILFGVGLILFDSNPESPKFVIRARAQRYNPDMFYVNNFVDALERKMDKEAFKKLFG